jgi:hypothetical protein
MCVCDYIPTILFQIYYSGFFLAMILTFITAKVQKPVYEKNGKIKNAEMPIVTVLAIIMAMLSWAAVVFLVIDLIEFIQRKNSLKSVEPKGEGIKNV